MRRYQIFVSSTFLDLKKERAAVLESILQMKCFPAGMELFPSASINQFEYIKEAQSPVFPMLKWSRCRSSQEVNGSPTPFCTLIYP